MTEEKAPTDPDRRPAVGAQVRRPVGRLVERLRDAGNDYTIEYGTGALYDLAADEIERLVADRLKPPAPVTMQCPTCRTAATFTYVCGLPGSEGG